jgi:hypothetical protein
MKKGQWSSTKAMAHYLHHDDEAKQDAQIKRIKRRQADGQKMNVCRSGFSRLVGMENSKPNKCLKTLERVKGIEPSYSAWKSGKAGVFSRTGLTFSALAPLRSLRNFSLSE